MENNNSKRTIAEIEALLDAAGKADWMAAGGNPMDCLMLDKPSPRYDAARASLTPEEAADWAAFIAEDAIKADASR